MVWPEGQFKGQDDMHVTTFTPRDRVRSAMVLSCGTYLIPVSVEAKESSPSFETNFAVRNACAFTCIQMVILF